MSRDWKTILDAKGCSVFVVSSAIINYKYTFIMSIYIPSLFSRLHETVQVQRDDNEFLHGNNYVYVRIRTVLTDIFSV